MFVLAFITYSFSRSQPTLSNHLSNQKVLQNIDVVAAYKSVVKEKEALEASLSALSTTSQTEACNNSEVTTEHGETREEDGGPPDPLGVNKQDLKDEIGPLKEQLRTLSTSLTTLTQEKKRIEANFIADKKKLQAENDDLQSKLTEERKRTLTQAEGFEIQITDLKKRIRSHQLEREKEQTDHALMLRELQTLVSTERMVKEAIENKLEESQQLLRESQEKVRQASISEVYERQVTQLQGELKTLRDRLRDAEVKANEPSPLLLQLQKEMDNMKSDHHNQVEKEHQKAVEAQGQLKHQSQQSEERVSSLESKLSELSQVVGNYEKLRFQDQQAIGKLRERVSQLDMENSALARAATLNPSKSEDDETQEPEKLLSKIMHLRTMLKSAMGKSESTINLATIFVEDMNKADEESPLCRRYKEELELTKEEFERYKLRAQSVLKNKNKDQGVTRETELLKEQVTEFRDKLRMANFHHQEEVLQYQMKTDNLSKALLLQEEKAKAELTQVKHSHQKEIGELEVERKKQRQRTVALLAEKDAEITELRARCGQSSEAVGLHAWSHAGPTDVSDLSFGDRGQMSESDMRSRESSEEREAIIRLMNLPKGAQSEAAFIHFSQEKSRMEVDIHGLRRQKHQLEQNYRDLQASSLQAEDELKQQIHCLKEKLAEIDRSDSREGANVEYIKNVMFKFLTSTADIHGKKQMMKALMTILQFSPEEKKKVDHVHARGWWTS